MKHFIKRALITLAGKDDKQFPVQQQVSQGKTADAEVLMPYGMHANLLAKETLCVMFPIIGEPDTRVVMGYTPNLRPKGLKEGEVVFYHPPTGTKIYFTEDGNREDTIDGDLTIIVFGNKNVTIEGDCNLTVNGNATVAVEGDVDVESQTSISLTAPQINING